MAIPLVSIIIPTYNMADFIVETIQCCLDQTHPNIEIIVVDDGSTDDTSDKVISFREKGVKYFVQSNHGAPAAARNHGIKVSNGEYLQFLDADDLLHEDKISKQVTQLEFANSQLTVSYCDYLFFKTGDSGKTFRRLGPPHLSTWQPSLIDQLSQYTVVHRFLFPRSTLDRYGAFDETMDQCEDLDLWMRLLVEGVPFKYIDSPMAYYRERIGMSVSNPKGQVLGHLKIIDKLTNQMSKLGVLSEYSDQLDSALSYWKYQLSTYANTNEFQ